MNLTIASYQGNAFYNKTDNVLNIMREEIAWAEENRIDILLFPECFLQGYILDKSAAREASIELNSKKFRDILKNIYSSTTVIFGLIEKDKKHLYNTAVIVEKGALRGKYRKQFLLEKEKIFSKGDRSPVFEKKGIKYGVNICADTRYSESALEMKKKGARILFFLLNNSLPIKTADKWKNVHKKYWIQRAKETSCWILTADVVEKTTKKIGYGFTTLISPAGRVVKSLSHLKPGRLTKKI